MGDVIHAKFGIEKDWQKVESLHAEMAATVLPGVSQDRRERIAAELAAMTRDMCSKPDGRIEVVGSIDAAGLSAIEHAAQQQALITIQHCLLAANPRVWRALRIAAGEE